MENKLKIDSMAKKCEIRAFIHVAQFSTLGDAGNHKELKSLLRHIVKHAWPCHG